MIKNQYIPIKPCAPYIPIKPQRSDFVRLDDDKATVVYHDIEMNGDTDLTIEEYLEDMDMEIQPTPEKRYWENLSLQDIVDLAPPGTRLCDIILHIDMPRHLEYTEVSFIEYPRDLDKEEERYQAALIKYEELVKEYEEKMIEFNKKQEAYNNYLKEKEIAELENKLNRLKKK